MLQNVTPESIGISSKDVLGFLKRYDAYDFSTHAIIMARGEKIFAESYYAPFHKDFKHRMYSVSKSFVGAAIGLCEEMGLLSLDDKFVDYFEEYADDTACDGLKEQTIRDMLKMSTCVSEEAWWFGTGTKDRTEIYFKQKYEKMPGTMFQYDSPGTYMLGVIVEKLTKKPFLEFLKDNILNHTEFSKDAYCIKCPGGYSFSDSGILCTARDLLIFAHFVMDKGVIDGRKYLNSEFLTEATKKQVDNDALGGGNSYDSYGYGYQIWKTPNDGFAFIGMGDQLAICDPKTDFIFIINSNNQGMPHARTVMYHELYNNIIPKLGEPIEENENDYNELCDYMKSRKLVYLKGNRTSSLMEEINNVTYKINDNRMKIEYVRFNFKDDVGVLTYKNMFGEKQIRFGFGFNEFGKFPQKGCPSMYATVPDENNMYDCAASAAWTQEQKLKIKIQIIDTYFGNISMVFDFIGDRIGISMKCAFEAFFSEYNGYAQGIKCFDK